MNEFIDTKFYEKYIKEIPIEEQIRGSVRAECRHMDKADIYEWITQDEIKIMNLQSKIDKANEYIEEHFIFDDKNGEYYQTHTFDKDNAKELHDILKEDK